MTGGGSTLILTDTIGADGTCECPIGFGRLIACVNGAGASIERAVAAIRKLVGTTVCLRVEEPEGSQRMGM